MPLASLWWREMMQLVIQQVLTECFLSGTCWCHAQGDVTKAGVALCLSVERKGSNSWSKASHSECGLWAEPALHGVGLQRKGLLLCRVVRGGLSEEVTFKLVINCINNALSKQFRLQFHLCWVWLGPFA